MSFRTLSIAGVTAVASLVGCAHQAASTATNTPPPVVAAAPTVREKPVANVRGGGGNESREPTLRGPVAHFEFDGDALPPDSQPRLQKVAEALRAHPKAHVRI